MLLEGLDVKRCWHLEVHHCSLKCFHVSFASTRIERFAGKGPAPSGAFPLLALSECQRRSRYYKSAPCGQHIGRRLQFRGGAVCSSTGGGHERQSVEDIGCQWGALRQG